jgi:SAM-dependent methyltransferase
VYSIEVDDVACPLCGSRSCDESFSVRDHEYRDTPRDAFVMRRCSVCSLYYLSPRPAVSALDAIYPPSYANFHTATQSSGGLLSKLASNFTARSISNRIQARRLAALLRGHLSHGRDDVLRVLDIGCGDGYSLTLIKAIFPSAVTHGVEVNPEAAARASGEHRIFVGDFFSLDLPGPYDLIVSSHVVEHVADPVLFMQRVRELLTPGGIAIIDTPNVDTPLFHMLKRHWGGVHAPRHWTLFSERTMRDLAERTGLDVRALLYMPIQIYWVWSLHSLLFERVPNAADLLFDPGCTNSRSPYALFLLSLAEIGDRTLTLFYPRTGQMRVVLAAASGRASEALHQGSGVGPT